MKLKDADMRPALREHIRQRFEGQEHRLIEELGLGNGRADLAVFFEGQFSPECPVYEPVERVGCIVYEVKSDADSFDRLGDQEANFTAYCDELWLVFTPGMHEKYREQFLRKVELHVWQAFHRCGVLLVDNAGCTVKQEAQPNTARSYDPMAWIWNIPKRDLLPIVRRHAYRPNLGRLSLVDLQRYACLELRIDTIREESLGYLAGRRFAATRRSQVDKPAQMQRKPSWDEIRKEKQRNGGARLFNHRATEDTENDNE